MKSILGATVTVTVSLLKLVQALALQTAVYEAVILGDTVILVPLLLLLQTTIPAQSLAVNVADWPLQIVVVPDTVGGEIVITFTTTSLLVALVLQLFVHTALYVPAELTEILVAVAPFDHTTLPLQALAVKVVLFPEQIVPPPLTVNTFGFGLIVTFTTADVP